MRLYDPDVERVAVKTIVDSEQFGAKILGRINEDHFGYEPTRVTFRRIAHLSRRTGEIPYWEDLLTDMALPEDVRTLLRRDDVISASTGREVKRLVDRLDEYRRGRALFKMTRTVVTRLNAKSVDLDELTDAAAEAISRARPRVDILRNSFSLGGPKFNHKFLMRTLVKTKDDYLPTGFKNFDGPNRGIPRGACFVLAGTTGAGKSTIALNIALRQALMGLRVHLTSLEMEVHENALRVMANVTGTSMRTLIYGDRLDKKDRVNLIRATHAFHKRVKNNGGVFRTSSPEEDVTIEDVLLSTKPFGYDNRIVDYIGLLAGVDTEDMWRKLSGVGRYAKRFGSTTNSVVTLLAQLSEEGQVRYSRGIQEHANNLWKFSYSAGSEERAANIITVKQGKARNQKAFDFALLEDFDKMNVTDLEVDVDRARVANDKRSKGDRRPQRGDEESRTYQL